MTAVWYIGLLPASTELGSRACWGWTSAVPTTELGYTLIVGNETGAA